MIRYSTPLYGPRRLMSGRPRQTVVESLIANPNMTWPLKRLFLEAALKDDVFRKDLTSALKAPIGKSRELDELHSRFGQGNQPGRYDLACFLKNYGLIRSIEYQEIRALFIKHAPATLLADPRIRLILDGRGLRSILADQGMRTAAAHFRSFLAKSFDTARFLDVSRSESRQNRILFKDVNVGEMLRYYLDVMASMRPF